MLIALTSSDEVNMIACAVADSLFRTPTKIARVRTAEYTQYPQLFGAHGLPIEKLIAPEQLVTDHIQRLIEHPGALQVLDFADGLVRRSACARLPAARWSANSCARCRTHARHPRARRGDLPRRRGDHADGDTVIGPTTGVLHRREEEHPRGDGGAAQARQAGQGDRRRRQISAGGSRTLEDRFQVKIIERNPEVARRIAEQLDRTIVLAGDAADESCCSKRTSSTPTCSAP